jgi:hypothetical protein
MFSFFSVCHFRHTFSLSGCNIILILLLNNKLQNQLAIQKTLSQKYLMKYRREKARNKKDMKDIDSPRGKVKKWQHQYCFLHFDFVVCYWFFYARHNSAIIVSLVKCSYCCSYTFCQRSCSFISLYFLMTFPFTISAKPILPFHSLSPVYLT